MKIKDVMELIEAKLLTKKEHLEQEILSVCGADLMSDVLAFTRAKTLLLTGLTSVQTVRTAQVVDLAGIVFVRGKSPGSEVIEMANAEGLPLLTTKHPLYETCGRLYLAGLKGCSELDSGKEADSGSGREQTGANVNHI
ncbi:MAG: hypothetical protein GX316_10145 [Firmicutes bacterium]|nr:hypothetical protein [Bacillota bacterium]